MTRKDYILLARALDQAQTHCENKSEEIGARIAMRFIANALASDGVRFNRHRWELAAQASQKVGE